MFLCVFEQIREELRANGIDVYPQKEFDEDAEDRMINEKIRVRGSFGNRSIICPAGLWLTHPHVCSDMLVHRAMSS